MANPIRLLTKSKPRTGGGAGTRRRNRAETEKNIETNLGKELTDLGEPASTAGTPRVQGQGTTGGIRESAQTAFTQTSKGKTLTKKIEELAKLRLKASGLSKEKRKEFLSKNKDKMDGLQASITDMKRRGIDKKMGGGKVMKKKVTYRKEGKKVGSSLTGNQKKLDVDNDGKITKKDFDTINAKPKSKPTPPSDGGATGRGRRIEKMDIGEEESMGINRKTSIKKKMGGGKVMKYKKGGMVYMKNGGVVKASKDGDDLVSSCYD
jgi:hypothetical protein